MSEEGVNSMLSKRKYEEKGERRNRLFFISYIKENYTVIVRRKILSYEDI